MLINQVPKTGQNYRYSNKNAPKKKDWNELSVYIQDYYPDLYQRIRNGKLTEQEKAVCELTFIGIQSGDIAAYLNVTPQRLSNLKAGCNNKLYGENNAKDLYSNMVRRK